MDVNYDNDIIIDITAKLNHFSMLNNDAKTWRVWQKPNQKLNQKAQKNLKDKKSDLERSFPFSLTQI
jgi:hypothetical protein